MHVPSEIAAHEVEEIGMSKMLSSLSMRSYIFVSHDIGLPKILDCFCLFAYVSKFTCKHE